MPQTKITCHVKMGHPATHVFQLEIHVEGFTDEMVEFSMPVWTPGSYLIREYSRNVDSVKAVSKSGTSLPVKKLSKNRWQVGCEGNDFVLHYNLYAFEESVRTCLLDDEHASIAPAAMFILPDNYDNEIRIHFHPAAGWHQISTALAMVDHDRWIRQAANKDELYDSPVEIGNHEIFSFQAAGIQHELAIYGKGNYNVDKILADIPKIVEEEVKIFGQHPCNYYLFVLLNSNSMRGGLEHLHSTSLIFKRFNYEPETNYNEFISLVAHEYFHLWNVKRLRPAALGPFDYNSENYTTSLWIAEGITSYYDDLIIRRCNLISERAYLDIVEKNINDALNPPGDAVHPVAEASMDAWIKYYRQNENSPNAQVNYYVKGSILAMALDMMIIQNTAGQYSLDNVMKDAYELFYVKENRGYHEEEFRTILEKYTGKDLGWFYSDHIFGAKRIDLKPYFEQLGIDLINLNDGTTETDLGITISDKNIITQVRKNSAGEKGGLNVNDELIAINGFRYTSNFLQTIITGQQPGDRLEITVSRNGIIKIYSVEIQKTDKANYKLIVNEKATEAQKALYDKWINNVLMKPV